MSISLEDGIMLTHYVSFCAGFDQIFSLQEMTLSASNSTGCPSIESPEIDVDYQTTGSSPAPTNFTISGAPMNHCDWILTIVKLVFLAATSFYLIRQ
jgi:hypothetical protein